MRALTTIPHRPRGSTAPKPRPAGHLARVRRVAEELTPDTIEQIAQRVAQLLRHDEPDPIDDGPSKPPKLIDADELARRYGLTRGWVYENAAWLGAIPLSDGPRPRLRFDPEVAAQALRNRRRRNAPSTVPLLPIHEPSSRGIVSRLRRAHRRWY
jgi:hypothetical protein